MKTVFERGSKRIVVASVPFWLLHLKLPLFQRPENRHHTAAIAHNILAQYQSTQELQLPGIITVAERQNQFTLVDGQHRVAALRQLTGHMDTQEFIIEVAVHQCGSNEEIFELYKQVNSSIPVPLIETECEASHRSQLRKELEGVYGVYLRTSTRPRAPCFNIDTFLKHYTDLSVWKLCHEPSARTVMDALLRMDAFLGLASPNDRVGWGLSGEVFNTYWHWYQHGEWAPRLIQHLNGVALADMTHNRHGIVKKLPVKLRRRVWEKRFPALLQGTCLCCDVDLSYDCFECGHVIARCLGGPDHVDNLEPVCGSCNRDMGIDNLWSYRNRLQNGLQRV